MRSETYESPKVEDLGAMADMTRTSRGRGRGHAYGYGRGRGGSGWSGPSS